MKNNKVLIEVVATSDVEAIKALQQKINTWITTGLMRRYQIIPNGDTLVFNICMRKEAK